MNIGTIITNALNRAQLSVSDYAMREMGFSMFNEIVQKHWSSKKWKFRKSTFNFNTSSGVEEYALDKYADLIIPNTVRGTDPVRKIDFRPSHDFFYKYQGSLEDGDPYEYRDGEMYGVHRQPSTSSTISFSSSLANYTTGTVNVTYGSARMVLSATPLTIDYLGRWIRVGTDEKRYRIVRIETSSIFYVSEPYEGTSNSTATLAIGDVQQKGIVLGFLDNGSVREEEVELNGNTAVATTQTYATLIRISKSGSTSGYVTATSNSGLITNIILDPGETDHDFKTVKLYPIPTKEERINYESYGLHPWLHRNTDVPLFPGKYHPFLQIELFIKLMNEFRNQDVSSQVLDRRDKFFNDMVLEDNDTDEWNVKQEPDNVSSERRRSNMPGNFEDEYED